MTPDQFRGLKRGDIVRHVGNGTSLIVDYVMPDDTYIAARIERITNPTEWALASEPGPEHLIRVKGFDFDMGPETRLECMAPLDGRCRPGPGRRCMAVEWYEEAGPDLVGAYLHGPGPWPVSITWTDDGPQLFPWTGSESD